jgi:membrane protein implicated in regulation of membrane protease activity
MIIGAILLAAELLGVEAAFYLIFLGVAAIIVGAIELAGVGLDVWLQWLLFAALAVISMVFFREKLLAKLRPHGVGYKSGPVGDTVTIENALEPGQSGRLAYRGSEWTVVNDGSETLVTGQSARISRVDGVKLNLKPIKE